MIEHELTDLSGEKVVVRASDAPADPKAIPLDDREAFDPRSAGARAGRGSLSATNSQRTMIVRP